MRKVVLKVAVCATLLCARTALAAQSPQQTCDKARVTAWKTYVYCVEAKVAKNAGGVVSDEFAAFAKCRHTYFEKWAELQPRASLRGSTCIGLRYTDNSDGSVTDNLSGLVWEKKVSLDNTPNPADPHDADNVYTWSTQDNEEDGTVFTTFLPALNGGGGFAGANGWRLPTLAELHTITLDFACMGEGWGSTCQCGSTPCVDPALDAANTTSSSYWSSTSYLPFFPGVAAWTPQFSTVDHALTYAPKTTVSFVRAVRGGL